MITPLCQRIFVRYARKPIWMPTARSKLFRLPEHTFYTPDEIKQIVMLKHAYHAQEKSIQEFMKQEFYIPATQSGGLPPEFVKKEIEADKALIEENDRINADIAKMKEEYFKRQMQDFEVKLLEEKARAEQQLLQNAQEVDDYVRDCKTNPDRFVTRENIDSLIEMAIENPVSYEFFVDPSGRRYGSTHGTETSQSKQGQTADT